MGQLPLKANKYLKYCNRFYLLTNFQGQKVFQHILNETNFQIGILWPFESPVNPSPISHTMFWSQSKKFEMSLLRKKESIYFEYFEYLKSLDLCQIREARRFNLENDGTTSLFFWML